MAAIYKLWDADDTDFIYLTALPWQLYNPINNFLKAEGFPDGVLKMNQFKMSTRLSAIFDEPEKGKIIYLEKLIKSYPGKKFVLVCNTSDKDPEIYAKIANKYPDMILLILIRNSNGEKKESKRIKDILKSYPMERFILFNSADEIKAIDITKFY